MKSKKLLLSIAVMLIGSFAVWRGTGSGQDGAFFRTTPVKRGNLDVSISATGTIEPEEVINVGAQVAGQILSFGADENGKTVDYGSTVLAGMVLARIDDSLYAADVAQAEAQLKLAQADFLQAQAKFGQAERDWARAEKLGTSGALAQSSYDAYRAVFETSKAGLAVSQATIGQAEAALRKAQRNLTYTTIKSPVNGVIIDRRVNIGQTVVASLNAPSLFLIAKDLKRMQVWVAVNEADIGSIHPGQAATFTVDAFPGEVFQARVGKTRLNATMTQNVVTYTVELATDNSSGRLLPYLTANVQFEVNKRENVLTVPNSALRWSPKEDLVKQSEQKKAGDRTEGQVPAMARVWVEERGQLRPVFVKAGASDGAVTEIESEELKEGALVIVGEQAKNDNANDGTKSPFTPQVSRGGRSR